MPELEALLADPAPENFAGDANRQFYLLLGRELAHWPEQRPLAARLFGRLFAGAEPRSGLRRQIGAQLVSLAEAGGDRPAAQAVLWSLRAEWSADQPPPFPVAEPLVQGLLREGMIAEAGDIVKSGLDGPWNTEFEDLKGELAFARGESVPQILVTALDLGAGAAPDQPLSADFSWELQGAARPRAPWLSQPRTAARPSPDQYGSGGVPSAQGFYFNTGASGGNTWTTATISSGTVTKSTTTPVAPAYNFGSPVLIAPRAFTLASVPSPPQPQNSADDFGVPQPAAFSRPASGASGPPDGGPVWSGRSAHPTHDLPPRDRRRG